MSGDEAEDQDWFHLADTMRTILCLQVHLRVLQRDNQKSFEGVYTIKTRPILIVEYDSIRSNEIEPEAASSRAEKKQSRSIFVVTTVLESRDLFSPNIHRRGTVNAAYRPFFEIPGPVLSLCQRTLPFRVVRSTHVNNIQHRCELAEQKNLVLPFEEFVE